MCHYNPFKGNFRKLAPHPALRATFPPAGGWLCGRMISAPTVSNVVGSMKRWVSKELGVSIWQKSFFDRVIRGEKDYLEIWQYIDENPLKWVSDELYIG